MTLKNLLCVLLLIVSMANLYAGESYLVMESHSGRVLLASASEERRPVASLTKIATAKVVLDWAKRTQTSLSEALTVPQAAFGFGSGNPMSLRPGDRLTLRDALYSALLGSDNIAAYSLADHVGRAILAQRDRGGDSQAVFLKEMNQLTKALGMTRTKMASSHGLDASGAAGYSTAADMARLAVCAMRDVGFTFYVKQKSREIKVIGVDGGSRSFKVNNTNKLIGKHGVNGVKTGYTRAAGACIAVNAHRSPLVKKIKDGQSQVRNRDLIVVVLGSANREARAIQLIQEAWPLYDAWAAQGFQVSPRGKELIVVPHLQ